MISNLAGFARESHRDLARRIDNIHNDLVSHFHRLECSIFNQPFSCDQTDAIQSVSYTIDMPLQLDSRFSFKTVDRKHAPQSGERDYASLAAWNAAFVAHFEDSTVRFIPERLSERMPSVVQWLNLMKCIKILTHVESSQLLSTEPEGLLWQRYFVKLQSRLRAETSRFSPTALVNQRLEAPELDELLNLPDSLYIIVIDEESRTTSRH